ncbi:hypothetical protein F2P81_005059 [Scophthalmus maximus]|uniref:Uncharacterized protein n=1 Tax=Scophthalmus maximus TaxID=52904 RepID=A0A6A4TP24_SCOMX|nr:hypothetical protein F2P81_005059 [Scophthalmus maximus]
MPGTSCIHKKGEMLYIVGVNQPIPISLQGVFIVIRSSLVSQCRPGALLPTAAVQDVREAGYCFLSSVVAETLFNPRLDQMVVLVLEWYLQPVYVVDDCLCGADITCGPFDPEVF